MNGINSATSMRKAGSQRGPREEWDCGQHSSSRTMPPKATARTAEDCGTLVEGALTSITAGEQAVETDLATPDQV